MYTHEIMTKYTHFVMFCNGGGFLSVKDAFSETGYPAFYRWEQSLKEMKWFCPPNNTQLNKNNTITHRVLVVKIQNQKSTKLG